MKTIRKVTNLPTDLVEEIEKFMKENYITTFTGAVIELIRRGLNKQEVELWEKSVLATIQ